MTLYDFIKLNHFEQAEAVWNGEFLTHREDGEDRLLLYSLGDFFVEVTYKGDLNKIITIKPFKSMRLLEPYWQEVDISELYDS